MAAPCSGVLKSPPSATDFPTGTKPGTEIPCKAILLTVLIRHVATEICHDSTRVNGEGSNPSLFATPVKFYRKEHICGFRLAIGLPPLIGATLKVQILEIDASQLVTA